MRIQAHADGWFIGLMSGTSLDGVDAVLARFGAAASPVDVGGHVHRPFEAEAVARLRRLNFSGPDELHQAALAGNALAEAYAQAVQLLCAQTGVPASAVQAIGAHGQTVRHQPEGAPLERYTIQLNNPAWLAERSGIAVVADFRRRDMAAAGQGAPLVPAFHRAVFARPGEGVAVLNLGGIANFSLLAADGGVLGFDCGPANTLMDAWCLRHTGRPYDRDGLWAASGQVLTGLLQQLLREPFFSRPVPRSTGVDLFNLPWLEEGLARAGQNRARAEDIQATLAELTALSCAQALARHGQGQRSVGVCGGGAYNGHVMRRLQHHIGQGVEVHSTQAWGLAPELVEACAFAWLARQCLLGLPGNVPAATQAEGERVLGAVYPA